MNRRSRLPIPRHASRTSPRITPRPAVTLPRVVWWALWGLLVALASLAPLPGARAAASPAWSVSEPEGSAAYAPECTPGNRVAYGRALVIPASDWICGDADAYGGSVRVLGRVSGNVVALGGAVTIGGEVDGNVSAFGGSVALLSTARVAGNVQVWGGHVTHAPGATVAGNIESGDRTRDSAGGLWPSFDPSWHFPLFWLLGWAALAALVATLLPERTARVRQVARGTLGRSLLVGLLTAVLGAGLAALLFATCIGIPLSLLLLVVLFAAWVLGTVAVSLWVGERLLGIVTATRPSPVLAAVVGAVALAAVESVPCLGGALTVVAGSVGLGAALLSRFGGRAPATAHSMASPPVPR